DLELDALERLFQVRIARGLDVRLQRAPRAVEAEIVPIQRAQAPRERGEERWHFDVEKDAVAFEPEAAGVRVVADQRLGRHLRDRLQAIAGHGDAVLDRTLPPALHLTDLVAPLRGLARGDSVLTHALCLRHALGRGRRRRNTGTNDNRCETFHDRFPLLTLIHAHQVVDPLALFEDFDTEVVLDQAEAAIDAHEIGLPLRVDVAEHFADAQRELALLPLLALVEHDTDTAHQIALGRRARRVGVARGNGVRTSLQRSHF